MRWIILIGAAVLLGAAASAFADDAEKGCSGNTYEIVTCQKAKLALLETRLAAAYKIAIERAKGRQGRQLQTSQQAWLTFRDIDCDYYELGEGTIARIEGGECMLTLTRQRAEELERAVEP